MGLGFGVRIAPGVRLRASSRGLGVSMGPRAARVHVGGGRTGVSTGAGPFSLYSGAGRGRRRTSVSAHERQVRQLDRVQAHNEAVETHNHFIDEFLNAHRQAFPETGRPIAPVPAAVDARAVRRELRREERDGVSFWKLSERRAARERADARVEARVAQLTEERQAEARTEQARLDEAWERLLANDRDVVLATLEDAFEDNEAPAAATGLDGATVSLIMRFPDIEGVVPEAKPDLTPTGRPTVKKRPKGERKALYFGALFSHALATVKEAFAVAPALTEATILVIEGQEDRSFPAVRPLFAARFDRGELADVPWETANAAEIVDAKSESALANMGGRAGEIRTLDLRGEPLLRETVVQIAEQLDWRVDPSVAG